MFVVVRPRKKNCLFPVTVQKKNRVGRSVKKKKFNFFFRQKCVIYACFTLIGSWEGRTKLRVRIFFELKLVRVGLQETNTFFRYNLSILWLPLKNRTLQILQLLILGTLFLTPG